MRVLIGCERFGVVREAFRTRGHNAWSCDLVPAIDGSSYHLQCDVRRVLNDGWDLAIFHPDCTYLTNSAAWAYGDGPYHQKINPGTLVGAARREARKQAVEFVLHLNAAPIPRKAIENPRGHLSTVWRKPDQTIQPNHFGDDASKATCLWLQNLPKLRSCKWVEPRTGGMPLFGGDGLAMRWANQTNAGQNRLSPSADRAMLRAATFPGIADAMAEQWGNL